MNPPRNPPPKNSNFREAIGCLDIDGRTYNLYKGLNTIGRNKTATIVIKNENVSQQHAIITVIDEKQQYVSDFQSFNGTFLGTKKLQALQLYQVTYDSTITFANVNAVLKRVPLAESTSDHCYNNRPLQNIQNTQSFTESFFAASTQALEAVDTNPVARKEDIQANYFDDDYNFADLPSPPMANHSISDTTVPTINDMPTQIYCSDVENVVSIGDSQIETTNVNKDQVTVSKDGDKPSIHDLPTQILCGEVALDVCVGETQNADTEESIHDMETQPYNITTSTSNKESINNATTQKNKEPEKNDLDDTTTEVIDATILDDSGLDVTIDTSTKSQPPTVISSLDSDTQSNLHVNQLHRRTLKPIADDSDEDVSNTGSDIASHILKKKKPIPESSPENSDTEVSKSKKPCKISSDSDTDIEDVTTAKKKVQNIVSSDSATEVEELDEANDLKKKKKTKTKRTISKSSGSDTDIDTADKAPQSSKQVDNSETLDDTEVIPATQLSGDEDDDDDFVFMPEGCSTIKTNRERMQESLDISQKLQELRSSTVLPEESSEASLNLGLTESMENNDGSIKDSKANIEDNEEDDDKTPDISDIEELDDTKPAEEDIFTKATQKLTVQKGGGDNTAFEMETQPLSEKLVESKTDEDVFLKPAALGAIKKTNKSQPIDDDLFMQPTQKLTSGANEDDIFMQPTQQLAVGSQDVQRTVSAAADDEDEMFMQPTQPLLPEASTSKAKHDDIFNQPTQVLGLNDKPVNEPKDDIFMQPTQVLTLNDTPANNQPKDDDDIFMQATQIAPNEQLKDDIFVEPTLLLEANEPPAKELQKQPTHHEIESQLEVMFASQPLHRPDTNTRPSNPLLNVFEGRRDPDSESIENTPDLIQSPKSLDCGSLKDYCDAPTLPIDELEDVQAVPVPEQDHQASEKSNKRNTRGKFTEFKQTEEEHAEVNLRKFERSQRKPVKGKEQEPSTSAAKSSKDKDDTKNTAQEETDEFTENIRSTRTRGRKTMNQKEVDEPEIPKTKAKAQASDSDSSTNVRKSGRALKKPSRFENSALEDESPSNVTKKEDEGNKEDSAQNTRTRGRKTNLKPDDKDEDESTEDTQNTRTRGRKNKRDEEDKEEKTEDAQNTRTRGRKVDLKAAKSKPDDEEDDTHNTRTHGRTINQKELRVSETSSTSTVESVQEKVKQIVKAQVHVEKQTTRSKAPISRDDKTNENTSARSLPTPRATRHTKAEEKKESKTVTKSGKNLKIDQKLKLNIIEEVKSSTSNENESSSSRDTIKPVSSRKSKRVLSTDSESNTTVTPSKKKKNAESPSESFSSKASNTRGKRMLRADGEKSATATPMKRTKPIESSSESEEILQTPTRSKKQTDLLNTSTSTPDRNRRKQKPKVVFTMLDSPELESLIRSLGGMVVDSVEASTVLVTGSLKRSQKLLSAVGQGKPICSPKWLQECKKASTFLDPWDFILVDKEAEKKWNFSLRESLNRSLNNKLFENFTVYLAVTNAVDVLKAAIESCGGKCLLKAPPKSTDANFVVVASPDNKTKYTKFLKQKPPVTVVVPEAIFDGVLRQELHLKDHMLSL